MDRITIGSAICHGKPCIRGLRYPVEHILELLSFRDIERTFAWLMRYRRLRADYETEPTSSRGWILVAAIHRMTRRLSR